MWMIVYGFAIGFQGTFEGTLSVGSHSFGMPWAYSGLLNEGELTERPFSGLRSFKC